MTITTRLPYELTNIIYSYLRTHAVEEIMKETACWTCHRILKEKNSSKCRYDGRWEHCYAVGLGIKYWTVVTIFFVLANII